MTNNEREELHKTIWAIADDLRGAVDGWDFKSYILSTMFYRFISENLTNYINQIQRQKDKNFDYANFPDEKAQKSRNRIIEEKGFFIYPSQLFCNVRKKAPYDENLNETLERIFRDIESSARDTESESNFKGLFDDFDVNSNKLGSTVAKRNEKLVKLLEGIGSMKLGEYPNNAIDAFGDAYEYLMAMYASNAGKSGGEYYTPQSVSELLTRLAIGNKRNVKNVYDPACGSGGLLLKAIKIIGKENVIKGFYGQEKNLTTYNLCRINMFLHDINYNRFHIACEDTLITPYFREDEGDFEVIVSNPPYSVKWAGSDNVLLINDERFSPAGVLAPKSKADLAFVMHSCSYLAENGVGAIVCFPGIMYRAGAEGKIRGYLVDNNFVDCVIQLPENLFFGTSIGTCIMVLKKRKTDRKILFIDASNECVKVTNNNILSSENIDNVVNVYQKRIEKENFSKLVDYETVRDLDYNLSVSTYVESKGEEEKFDIDYLNVEIKDLDLTIQDYVDSVNTFTDGRFEELKKKSCDVVVEFVKLGEVAEIRAGFGFPLKEQGKKEGDFPFYKVADMNHIENSIYMNVSENYITFDTAKKLKCNPAPKNTIIFPKVGMTIKTNKKRLLSQVSCYDNNIFGLIADEKYILSKFLYYLFDQLDLIKFAFGETAVPSIRKSAVENFEIPIPPLELQEEIVNNLDVFTNLISNLEKIITLRKKQYAYYLDELLTFGNDTQKVKLGSLLISNIGGGTPRKNIKEFWNGNIPWASVKDVNKYVTILEDTEDKITELGLNNSNTKIVKKGETIVCTRINPGKMLIAGKDVAINQDLRGLKLKEDIILPYFLLYYFQTLKIEGRGTTVKGISVEELENTEIPLPTLDIQKEIVHYLDQFTTLISLLEKKLELTKKQYAYYRDELLMFERK